MSRVAVFGGSFNPPHVAHVLAAAYVLSTQPVDHLIVVPAFTHPFGKALVSYEHRTTMCSLAFADLHRVAVSDIERTMAGESRTLFMLRALRDRHPDWAMRLVVGSDILVESPKWFAWDDVVALAPPIVLGRIGFEVPGAPIPVLPRVASRDVRAAIARGDPPADLLPTHVLEYVRAHALYQDAA